MSSVCYFAKIAKMFVITLIPPNFFVISCQRLFILHSSFCENFALAPRKVSFDRAKDHVSSPQT